MSPKQHVTRMNRRARAALKSAAAALPFAALFIAAESLEQVVPLHGAALGLMAAAVIALLLKPVGEIARRVSWRIWCIGKSDLDKEQKRWEVYQGTLEGILMDGEITATERHILERLQRNLGIEPGEARWLEVELRMAKSWLGGGAAARRAHKRANAPTNPNAKSQVTPKQMVHAAAREA